MYERYRNGLESSNRAYFPCYDSKVLAGVTCMDKTVLSYAQFRPSRDNTDLAIGERKERSFRDMPEKTALQQIAEFLAEGAVTIGSHLYPRSQYKIYSLPIGY